MDCTRDGTTLAVHATLEDRKRIPALIAQRDIVNAVLRATQRPEV